MYINYIVKPSQIPPFNPMQTKISVGRTDTSWKKKTP